MQRLDSYARNLVDYHMITDLVPLLASLYFTHRMPGLSLSRLQCALLMAVGAQRRSVDAVEEDLNVPAKQLLALFNKAVRKVSKHLRGLQEKAVDATIPGGKGASAPTTPGKTSSKPKKSAKKAAKKAAGQYMEQYEVRGSDSAWAAAEAAVAAIVRKGGDASGTRASVAGGDVAKKVRAGTGAKILAAAQAPHGRCWRGHKAVCCPPLGSVVKLHRVGRSLK